MNIAKNENVIGALVLAPSDTILTASDGEVSSNISAPGLALIGHEPGISIHELSQGLGLSHPGTVRVVDRMVARNLVVRKRSLEDARAVELFLTPSGKQQEQSILASRKSALGNALAFLTADEIESLSRISEKLLSAILVDEAHAFKICRLCDSSSCIGCPIEEALLRGAPE
jgi:MarR family transcriptional repressor of emrRAB